MRRTDESSEDDEELEGGGRDIRKSVIKKPKIKFVNVDESDDDKPQSSQYTDMFKTGNSFNFTPT